MAMYEYSRFCQLLWIIIPLVDANPGYFGKVIDEIILFCGKYQNIISSRRVFINKIAQWFGYSTVVFVTQSLLHDLWNTGLRILTGLYGQYG